MKRTTSISRITHFFIFFLFLSGYNYIDKLYISFKHGIVNGDLSLILMNGFTLLSLIALGVCFFMVMNNINKQLFFTKKNFIYFYAMGVILYLPVIVYTIIRWTGGELEEIEHSVYFAAGSFMLILAEIFRYGYRLKEEQELTI